MCCNIGCVLDFVLACFWGVNKRWTNFINYCHVLDGNTVLEPLRNKILVMLPVMIIVAIPVITLEGRENNSVKYMSHDFKQACVY